LTKNFTDIAIQIPQVLLPRPGIDLTRWAVVACDQYTSQPAYWKQVESFVGQTPSTLHLIFPEVYLEEPDAAERIERIQEQMRAYLAQGILVPDEGFVYVERTLRRGVRRGLLACLDLEQYDYRSDSQSLIRATEGTILDRLPPRMRIRQGAPLELPHVMVLIDDPDDMVIGTVAQAKPSFRRLYDFDLMMDGGRLAGWLVADSLIQQAVVQALRALKAPQAFRQKYGLDPGVQPLLYAVGDGNHSLASAKAVWDGLKPTAAPDHPARYALVEIVNLHDSALEFEPIHRVLFNLRLPVIDSLQEYFGNRFSLTLYNSQSAYDEMVAAVNAAIRSPQLTHAFGMITAEGCGLMQVRQPASNLPAATLQRFLDHFMQRGGAEKIDYVHGDDVLKPLCGQENHAGFYLPAMSKHDLFKAVILSGALPRKTFSMGEPYEKRYYMECRRIGL